MCVISFFFICYIVPFVVVVVVLVCYIVPFVVVFFISGEGGGTK